MSARALALAVRDKIRVALTLDATTCRFMEDGRPPAFAGDLWVSVHYGSAQVQYAEGLQEEFAVAVTVTRRTSYAPQDTVGEEVFAKETEGLDSLVRKIVVAVMTDLATAGSPSVLNRANAILGGGVNGFAEKFTSADEGRPEQKGPEWFSARGARPNTSAAGMAQTVTFRGAKRFQTWESAQ